MSGIVTKLGIGLKSEETERQVAREVCFPSITP
jgi:hypothetical protein